MNLNQKLEKAIEDFPLIAILRGLEPQHALGIGNVLFDAGFRIIEVPLNSPKPFESIKILSNEFKDRAIIGAGTVLTTENVKLVADAGGEIIVSPNANVDVIKYTKELGLLSAPGVQTPTEAFSAIEAGADTLKFFPGEAITPVIFKALKAVLPPSMPCMIVGGVKPETMKAYQDLGADGFGIGSGVFKAGDDAKAVEVKALAFKAALQKVA